MSELGPLETLLGRWEGNVGLDISFHHDDDHIEETGYFEKASFSRIPVVNNGSQRMHGLNYQMTAWRHGEEKMDPFHDEVGYLLWEEATGLVMRCFAVPRGIALLAAGKAAADSKVLEFKAELGSSGIGLLQNPYLLENAKTTEFVGVFTIEDDDTFSYTSDLTLDLAAYGGVMHHTDKNTLQRVAS